MSIFEKCYWNDKEGYFIIFSEGGSIVEKLNDEDIEDLKDYKEAIEEYKKNYTGPSEEELFEMRASFGDNVTVIGVLTGNVIELCGGGTY